MNGTEGSGRPTEGPQVPPEQAAGTVGGETPTEAAITWESSDAAQSDPTEADGIEATAVSDAIDGGEDGTEEEEPKHTWKWWALAAIFIFLAGIVVLLVLTRSDTSEVPDVRNLTLEDATAAIEEEGLKVGEVAYLLQSESDAEPGTVAEQSPEAGSQVDPGSKVDLLLVAPNKVEVPNVVGFDVDEATDALESLSLEVTTQEVDRVGAPAGSVVEQSPSAGTKVDPGSTVQLSVAGATTAASVPNVVGATQQAATSQLESAGFSVAVEEAYDAQVAKGIVISQRPAAGVTAAIGEVVTIVVSLGQSPEVAVPNVVGRTEADAANQLNQLGLEPVPSTSYSSSVPAGSVISQNPGAGTIVLQGSFVNILISQGPEPAATATVPNVMGKSESEATSALQAAGYQVVSAQVYSDTVTIGTVGWQIPTAGSITEPGATVAIIVSAGPRPPEFTTVPDVRSMTVEDATQVLEAAGLLVEAYEVYTSVGPAGQVVAQLPAPGQSVAPGSTVIIVVSLGEGEPVVTPY